MSALTVIICDLCKNFIDHKCYIHISMYVCCLHVFFLSKCKLFKKIRDVYCRTAAISLLYKIIKILIKIIKIQIES